MSETNETKKINSLLYEHNLEIALKNKTLLLLEKLYQKSILTLSPEDMAQAIVGAIREYLNLEFTGILNFSQKTDSLIPLAFSKSNRLIQTLRKLGFLFLDIKITNIKKRIFLKRIVYDQKFEMTDKLEKIWKDLIKPEHLQEIKNGAHIKTILLYPLSTSNEVLGVLILGLNRDYQTLNTFEKSSITSFTNVITLSLNKAYLYKDLQDANKNLQDLIKQRESLVHLVTHKVKGSFTRTKCVFAEMIDGTFGVLPPKAKEMAEMGLASDNEGINTVDLVLNAANMQKGTIKYDLKPMDFKDIVLKVIAEKKIPAEKRGLQLKEEIKADEYNISGDAYWLKEAVNNLIDNSIKYTKQGKVTVGLKKGKGKILFTVKDTGVGITADDKKNLFTEGGRGKNSVTINVDSTGYGLYTVKQIVEAHQGRVWAESDGEGRGSKFCFELPLARTNAD